MKILPTGKDFFVAAIIPSRMSSSRFPGKPLALIDDKTMIEHVYRRVSKVVDTVVVATDDDRIRSVVERFGGNAVLTSCECANGTMRCLEALQSLSKIDTKYREVEIVVNVQGDEPLIDPNVIRAVVERLAAGDCDISTAVFKAEDKDVSEVFSPDTVKVGMDNRGEALYFSRSPIPYVRDCEKVGWLKKADFYIHTGIYAYSPETLALACSLPESSLEKAECLEQLKWLQAGLSIGCVVTDYRSIGVDTPEDLEKVRKLKMDSYKPSQH